MKRKKKIERSNGMGMNNLPDDDGLNQGEKRRKKRKEGRKKGREKRGGEITL